MKDTINQMLSEFVSKDALYGPMKQMKEELPKYLEENQEKLSFEDLERYNNQLDLVEKLVEFLEKEGEPDQKQIIE